MKIPTHTAANLTLKSQYSVRSTMEINHKDHGGPFAAVKTPRLRPDRLFAAVKTIPIVNTPPTFVSDITAVKTPPASVSDIAAVKTSSGSTDRTSCLSGRVALLNLSGQVARLKLQVGLGFGRTTSRFFPRSQFSTSAEKR